MNKPLKPAIVTSYILIAITLVVVAILIWRVSDLFTITFGGVVFATILRALALPLSRQVKISPRWSLTIVVVGLIAGFCLLGWFFGSAMAQQTSDLGRQLPVAARKFEIWLQGTQVGRIAVQSVQRSFADSKTLANVGLAATALAVSIMDILLIVFLGVYFAADPALYRDGALRLLPPSRRPQVRAALNDAGEALQKWLVGQLIAMVSVGMLVGLCLALVGVPLALSLAVLTGLLEFVPVAGPIVAAVIGILVGFSKSPQTALYALVVYTIVQQLESNLIIPVIQRWAAELPPAVTLLAVFAFGTLLGTTGIVFATPIAVVLMALVKHLYVEDTLENGGKPQLKAT